MRIRFLVLPLLFCLNSITYAENLAAVYQQALSSDCIYQRDIANHLATQEIIAISRSYILPTATISAYLTYTVLGNYYPNIPASIATQQGYQVIALFTQTLFDMSQFAKLSGSKATAKASDATLRTQQQELLLRTAKAYFSALEAEENARAIRINKALHQKQLTDIKNQYDLGTKIITDVATAQSAYDASNAKLIGADNQIMIAKENLRVITGKFYSSLSSIENFSLLNLAPMEVEQFIEYAYEHNWQLQTAVYKSEAAKQFIKQQSGQNYPSVILQGSYNYISKQTGIPKIYNKTLVLAFTIPLTSGGETLAQTKQAQYHYQAATDALEQEKRNVADLVRQYYFEIIATVNRIQADKSMIKALQKALEGMQLQYTNGIITLSDVLSEQEKLLTAKLQYVRDKYYYLNNLLLLKATMGTLNYKDLQLTYANSG